MKFHSAQFGTQDIDPESILTFPQGMPGFENITRYKLFHEDKERPVAFWLQSIDDPNVAFSVVDPAVFGLNYEFVLSDEEEALLKMESVEDIAVFLITYKQQTDADSEARINANINGPIVLNARTRIGMQKVMVGVQTDITLRSTNPAV